MDIFSIRLHRGDRQRIRGTFTHTQNEKRITVGTCCLPFVFYKRIKVEFCVCFDENVDYRTSVRLRSVFVKNLPLLRCLLVGLRSSSIAMVCVTARSLVTLFYIITETFTHTQNEMIKTVGTCCLPFIFISG